MRIIYPFAAGGSGDALTRLVADKIRASLDRQVIVENRTGGEGRIGVNAVRKAAPDGSAPLVTPIAPMANDAQADALRETVKGGGIVGQADAIGEFAVARR